MDYRFKISDKTILYDSCVNIEKTDSNISFLFKFSTQNHILISLHTNEEERSSPPIAIYTNIFVKSDKYIKSVLKGNIIHTTLCSHCLSESTKWLMNNYIPTQSTIDLLRTIYVKVFGL